MKVPIIKLEMDLQGTILPQVIGHIKNGNFPLTITEGDSSQKINKIIANSYLRFGFEKFGTLKTDILLSYGWNGSSNEDQHIYDALIESRIRYWYFGLFGPNANDLKRVNEILGALNAVRRHKLPSIKLVFYDTATFSPWVGN